ncbi:unnamed protein product [Rhizoctonia solani]|uniref:F-box domain-containing protein n=1 Tax=Rhizoctonia solani TaxID=456999 RepID=A0A8H3BA51_9AGAM|nr:unnamed protein product [Rhizoctonia solani]
MRTRRQTRLTEESNGASDDVGSLAINEEAGSTTSARDVTPQRKKRAMAKIPEPSKVKKVNRIKGKLSGILLLPIEVFVEIMRHLALPDVLSLSRSNRFFRQMLMTRSATTLNIWRGSVDNVPGLPPCPEGLCEPQYAALIYTKYCSMCGARIVKEMDPYLNVRICKDCVEMHVIHCDEVDDEVQLVIPESRITRMKTSRYGMKTCLIRDVEEAEKWFEDLYALENPSKEEVDAMFDKRFRKLRGRKKYAKEMEEFLCSMAQARTQEIDELKEQRRQDIKRRLEDAGWEERDWIFPEFVARKWSSLVEAPQALTDRAWQKLYPSMVPYLEQNRRWQTQRSKLVRKGKRLRRMRRLLVGIRNQSYLLEADGEDVSEGEEASNDSTDVQVAHNTENTPSSSDDGFSSITEDESDWKMEKTVPLTANVPSVRVRAPFPPMVDLLEWPIISNILKIDTDADTMQEKFEELRDEIEDEIRSWGSTIEEELIGLLKVDSTDDTDLDSDMPLLQLQTEGASVDSLTPAARLLLRADSVFRISENNPLVAPMPIYFPEIFPTLQSRPDGYCTTDFKRPGGHKRPKHGYTWDLSEVEYYPEGSVVAKALLKQLGRVDAAQFELQGLGARFTCGSCGDKWPRTWNEMVQHYAEAIIHASMATKAKASVKKRVKYSNIHSLDRKAKRKPLLVLHSEEEAKALSLKRRKFESLVQCISCDQLGIDFECPRDLMLKHVRTAHAIKPPKAEHYKRTYNIRKHVRVYDPTGNVSASTEATDQEIVKRIVSGYASYGTCVFWSDYGRHADAYDGCTWHEFFDKGLY